MHVQYYTHSCPILDDITYVYSADNKPLFFFAIDGVPSRMLSPKAFKMVTK